LVSIVTKKNSKYIIQELKKLDGVSPIGPDLIRCVIEQVWFQEGQEKEQIRGNISEKDQAKVLLLPPLLSLDASPTPSFASVLVATLESLSTVFSFNQEFFVRFGKALKFNLTKEILFSFSLIESITFPEEGHRLLKAKLHELTQCSTLPEFPPFLIRQLSLYLVKVPQLASLLFENENTPTQRKNQLRKLFKDSHPFDATSLLSPNRPSIFAKSSNESEDLDGRTPLENHVFNHYRPPGLVRNLGPDVTTSPERFKKFLSEYTVTEERVSEMLMVILSGEQPGLSRGEDESKGAGGSPPSSPPRSPPSSPSISPSSSSPPLQSSPPPSVLDWNVDVFVSVVDQLKPNLNWNKVFSKLDSPSFLLPDSDALHLLFQTCTFAKQQPFPVHEILLASNWTNLLGQLRFLTILLSLPDDKSVFESTPNQLSALERPSVNSRVSCWYSIDLVNRLIQIAGDSEAGEEIYGIVSGLFDFPLKHCPDVLILCLVETPVMREAIAASPPSSRPKSKIEIGWTLFSILISSFLTTNHRSASHVLRSLWASHPHLVVKGMSEVYQHQPSQITRLFDITQELKGLRRVLDTAPIIFSIDMATLAGRRGYLNLESWLIQNVSTHQKSFVSACVRYLWDRSNPDSSSGEGGGTFTSTHLTNDMRVVILKVLQGYVGLMSPSLLEDYKKLSVRYLNASNSSPGSGTPTSGGNGGAVGATAVAAAAAAAAAAAGGATGGAAGGITSTSGSVNSRIGMSPSRGSTPQQIGGGSFPPPSPSKAAASQAPPDAQKSFPPDIEETANAYFQQIYTSQLSIDDAVVLLSRCKNSSNTREQDVFACMIHNLFDEYRFFHKYPDKELEITGILFGSLIQHQLVSMFALAMALKYVLEALRTPNTKMFRFGYLALQQFKGRLKEWVQYSSQILQIEHIKQFPDLVEHIENVLQNATSTPGPTPVPTPPPSHSPLPPLSGSAPSLLPPASLSTSGGGPIPRPGSAGLPPLRPSGEFPAPGGDSFLSGSQGIYPPLESLGFGPSSSAGSDSGSLLGPDFKPGLLSSSGSNSDAGKSGSSSGPGNSDSKGVATGELKGYLIITPPEAKKDGLHFIFNNVSEETILVKGKELAGLLEKDYVPWLAVYLLKRIYTEFNQMDLYLRFISLKSSQWCLLLQTLLLAAGYKEAKKMMTSQSILSSSPERVMLKNVGSLIGRLTLARNRPLLRKDICLKQLLILSYESGKMFVVIPFVCRILDAVRLSKFTPNNAWVMAHLRLLIEIYHTPNLKMNLKFEVEKLCKDLDVPIDGVPPTTHLKGLLQPTINNQDMHLPKGEQGPVLVINPNIYLFSQFPKLKKHIQTAIDAAIREILSPIVERSVAISCITTREMTLKDFGGGESEQTRLRTASHSMVQYLSGSLASVTCREPLCISMINHLRSLLQNDCPEGFHSHIETAVSQVCSDNLEAACSRIEKAAMEKAVSDADDYFPRSVLNRQQYQSSLFVGSLPEFLRPPIGVPLQQHQSRVYEDFPAYKPSSSSLPSTPSPAAPSPSSPPVGSEPTTPLSLDSSTSASPSLLSAGSVSPSSSPARSPSESPARSPSDSPLPGAISDPSQSSTNLPSSLIPSLAATTLNSQSSTPPPSSLVNDDASPSLSPSLSPIASSLSPSLSSSLSSSFPSLSPSLSPNYPEGASPSHAASSSVSSSYFSTSPSGGSSPSSHTVPSPSFYSSSTFSESSPPSPSPTLTSSTPKSSPDSSPSLSSQAGAVDSLSVEEEVESVYHSLEKMFSILNRVDDLVIEALDAAEEESFKNRSDSTSPSPVSPHSSPAFSPTSPSSPIAPVFDLNDGEGTLNLSSLPRDHELFALVHQITSIAQRTSFPSPRDELASSFALKLYQNLFEIRERLLLDIYLLLLNSLHRLASLSISRVLTESFITDCKEERAMNSVIVAELIAEGFLYPHEIDGPLAEYISGGSREGAELGLGLMRPLLGGKNRKEGESEIHASKGVEGGEGSDEGSLKDKEIALFGESRLDNTTADPMSPYNLSATVEAVKRLRSSIVGSGRSITNEDGGGLYGGPHGEDFCDPNVHDQCLDLFSDWIALFEKHVPSSVMNPTFRNVSSLYHLVSDADSFSQDCSEWFGRFEPLSSRFCHPSQEVPVIFLKVSLVAAIESYYTDLKNSNHSPSSSNTPSSDVSTDTPAPPTTPTPTSEKIDPNAWWSSFRLIYGFCSLIGFLMRRGVEGTTSSQTGSGGKSGGPNSENDEAAPESEDGQNSSLAVSILQYTLDLATHLLSQDVRGRPTLFCQRPYHQIFVCLLEETNDPFFESLTSGFLCSFSSSFMTLQPTLFPSFVFSWVELISHRHFMPKMLFWKKERFWPIYRNLVVDLFTFMDPFLSKADLTPPLRLLYKGTLRMLLVLLHDFPEFLCDNHFTFCDVLPPSCIQIRNLILSAFPRNMRLPDPFMPHLKVDLLPEINQPTRVMSNFTHSLSQAGNLKQEVDAYLATRNSPTFLVELQKKLYKDDGSTFNVPLINSLVLYVGTQALGQIQTKPKASMTTSITDSGAMDMYQHLLTEFSPQGRYLLLNGIVNQLRYPNNHTHYFSCVLLYLFEETTHPDPEVVQEQITRVLLERLIVNRPHPWGLLITFIELIKNPRYLFWSRSFTRCAPEIKRLFESVSSICKIESSPP